MAKAKGIPPFLLLYFSGNPDTRAQAKIFEATLQAAQVPVKSFGKGDSNHRALNHDLGKPEDSATQALYKFLEPLAAQK